MKRFLGLSTAAGLLLSLPAAPATAAGSDGVVARLADYCLTSTATPAQIARAGGMVAPPKDMARQFPTEFVKDPTLLWSVYDGGVYMFIAGKVNPERSPLGSSLTGDVCAVVAMPAQASSVDALQAALGVPPITAGGQKMFAYEDVGGKRAPVDPSRAADFARALQAGSLRIALVADVQQTGASGTVAMLLVPKTDKAVALNSSLPAR